VILLQDAGESEDIAQVIVDNQHFAARQHGIRLALFSDHALLFGGK